jgi:hypothetical protein
LSGYDETVSNMLVVALVNRAWRNLVKLGQNQSLRADAHFCSRLSTGETPWVTDSHKLQPEPAMKAPRV